MISDRETWRRLYQEYKKLDEEYRKLSDKLNPSLLTTQNHAEKIKLLELARAVEDKLNELLEASGVKRIPLPPK